MNSSRPDHPRNASQGEQSYQPPDTQEEAPFDADEEAEEDEFPVKPLPPLPPLPKPDLDVSLDLDLDSIIGPSFTSSSFDKMQKRASNVMKLSEENDKLKEELRAMTERIEAAERRRADLEKRAREAKGESVDASTSS
ncbi:hypothetical protein BV25DRAFT_1914349 [Artomyces pyxidatus]|uniref:Uncharacterized protein n=1 Tax=Artomyces pyxidatus TaxID=48021 RepID=A0ACB8T895_9AGAM|nr:hypothetical protein BV25DRAFT_1914349 [Artomyces pyxidatus]